MKLKILFILLLVLCNFPEARIDKLRFSGNSGLAPENTLLSARSFSGGGALHLSYPVSPATGVINTELSIINDYRFFKNSDDRMHLIRFGFGIRVFLNTLKTIRPYFTHDITSQLIIADSYENYASAFGVLLGLGVDIPVNRLDVNAESSSVFVDISYNKTNVAYFQFADFTMKFMAVSFGYSWKL
ncbi:MAG: hypothetical protein U5N56_01565 [Candidatus Marinimicrobia bacterium]|nr:hypothetical protein [Candidatus Neomarinimicrobiota bacterium]